MGFDSSNERRISIALSPFNCDEGFVDVSKVGLLNQAHGQTLGVFSLHDSCSIDGNPISVDSNQSIVILQFFPNGDIKNSWVSNWDGFWGASNLIELNNGNIVLLGCHSNTSVIHTCNDVRSSGFSATPYLIELDEELDFQSIDELPWLATNRLFSLFSSDGEQVQILGTVKAHTLNGSNSSIDKNLFSFVVKESGIWEIECDFTLLENGSVIHVLNEKKNGFAVIYQAYQTGFIFGQSPHANRECVNNNIVENGIDKGTYILSFSNENVLIDIFELPFNTGYQFSHLWHSFDDEIITLCVQMRRNELLKIGGWANPDAGEFEVAVLRINLVLKKFDIISTISGNDMENECIIVQGRGGLTIHVQSYSEQIFLNGTSDDFFIPGPKTVVWRIDGTEYLQLQIGEFDSAESLLNINGCLVTLFGPRSESFNFDSTIVNRYNHQVNSPKLLWLCSD